MAGSKVFRKIEIGKESGGAAGTPVASTTVLRAMGTAHDQREVWIPEEEIGYAAPLVDRAQVVKKWTELSCPDYGLTYEQGPYVFEAGVAIEVATQDGAGSGYLYNYLAPTTAANTIETYTIEGGDNQQAEEFDYAFVQSFAISGVSGEGVMISADWFGREASNTTFTGSSVPTVEDVLMNGASLYIDDSGGSVGGTAVTGTLFEFNLDWNTGLQAFWAVDGSDDFNLVKITDDHNIELTCTFEHNATAVTEKADYRSGAIRLVRLKFEGSDLGTSATYSKKTLLIDLAGVWTDWSELGERDGNNIIEATLQVGYSPTDSLLADVTFVNELSALT